MEHPNQMICYDRSPSYRLHHVSSCNAEDTTRLPLHYDGDVTLVYFRQGGGSVRIEGRYYPVETGDLILLNPRELHCFTFQAGLQDRLVLYLKEDIIRNFQCPDPGFFDIFYHRSGSPGNHIPAAMAEACGIQTLMDQILSLTCEESGWNEILAICRIVELVAIIGRLHRESTEKEPPVVHENGTVSQILRYINENLLSIPDTDQIARHFFRDKAYLCRLFKQHVGASLWNYVIFRRLLYSNDLIREGASIEEACYQSGFQNYSNYFRLYKKYFGVSPSEFHRRSR